MRLLLVRHRVQQEIETQNSQYMNFTLLQLAMHSLIAVLRTVFSTGSRRELNLRTVDIVANNATDANVDAGTPSRCAVECDICLHLPTPTSLIDHTRSQE